MTAAPVPEPGPDPASWREHRSGVEQVDELLRALAVEPVGKHEFTASSTGWPTGRVFGGQILAQSMIAAQLTVDGPGVAHSLHAYFMRAGRTDEEIRFVVDPLRDGRSYSTRRIDAVQGGLVIATSLMSFGRPEDGPDHQDELPERPAPDDLAPRVPFAAAPDGPSRAGALELRACSLDDHPDPAATSTWMRIGGRLPDDPLLHRALLVYLSDLTLVHGAFRRQGLSRRDIRTASLDHALWLYRPARVDEWVLYDSRSPSAAGGRAAGAGRLFSVGGELLASAAQEMSVRVKR
ncbi:acyl-CoA thioesterase [Pseudonocardia lacus]|uniref:acyl-CoA thioesterase n=1 Tax=Pseudonocardia lacus TaxID=2835865 RepID=UPI001BDCE1DE|nr:acyl-CoA thioesterase domain-containing protein [Pseudonocardia lacus]